MAQCDKKYVWIVRSKSRKYGYTIFHDSRIPYLYDGHSEGWYKYKRDAVSRAVELGYVLLGKNLGAYHIR